jgi:hypothetical protein
VRLGKAGGKRTTGASAAAAAGCQVPVVPKHHPHMAPNPAPIQPRHAWKGRGEGGKGVAGHCLLEDVQRFSVPCCVRRAKYGKKKESTAIRRPLQAAATAWCHEAGTSPSKSGLAGAIRWAATVRMPQGAVRAAHPAAGAALRDCAVKFYAKAMAIRYNKSKTSSSVSKAAASQPSFAI